MNGSMLADLGPVRANINFVVFSNIAKYFVVFSKAEKNLCFHR